MNSVSNLTERDLKVMIYIAENRFVTSKLLCDLFWKNKGSHAHLRRLRILKGMGLIQSMVGDRNQCLAYRLTAKGSTFLRSNGLISDYETNLRNAYRTTFDHDEKLQRVQAILLKSKIVSNYQNDRSLKEKSQRQYYRSRREYSDKIPDGCFELTLPKKALKVALELELSSKSKKRYDMILQKYWSNQSFDSVFYVVGTLKVQEKIQIRINAIRSQNSQMIGSTRDTGFYFCELGNLLHDGLKTPWNGEGSSFSIADLEQRLPSQIDKK